MSDYSHIDTVCFDCAREAGFTPKDKVVGVWVDKCEICGEIKPCTDLWHDWNPLWPKWNPPEKGGAY